MNGMNITLKEFINWSKKLNKTKFLTKEAEENMWQVFPYTETDEQFTFGWDKHVLNNHNSYGFSGNLVNAYRIFPDDNLSIIFLSNGLSELYDVEYVINHLANIVDADIVDADSYVYENLFQTSIKEGFAPFKNKFSVLKNKYLEEGIEFEYYLNVIGYWHLNHQHNELAIQIFELNMQESPESWNDYDSLGEAYEVSGNTKEAIFFYRKAIELNPENENNNNQRLKSKISEWE